MLRNIQEITETECEHLLRISIGGQKFLYKNRLDNLRSGKTVYNKKRILYLDSIGVDTSNLECTFEYSYDKVTGKSNQGYFIEVDLSPEHRIEKAKINRLSKTTLLP